VIDWLKFRAPYTSSGRVLGDRHFIIDTDGGIVRSYDHPVSLEGSHDQRLSVRTDAYTGLLLIDGNPTNFFQGHNLFGTESLVPLAAATFARVAEMLKLPDPEGTLAQMHSGDFDILKVDINKMYSLGSRANANAALRSLEASAHIRGRAHSGGVMDRGTVYFCKHSRRRAVKAYAKGQQLDAPKHSLAKDISMRSELMAYADDKLRIEVRYMAMDLKRRGLDRGKFWSDTLCDTLYAEMLATLEIPAMIELPSDTVDGLPARLQLVYQAWKRGDDIRAIVARRSFFRYRKEMLKFGIDISVPQPKEPRSNVLPFVRILEAVPVGVPEWALGTSLYFDPRKTA
jgi:II/X family phage/plasmid replication protein